MRGRTLSILILLLAGAAPGQTPEPAIPREDLKLLREASARRPFLEDCPDPRTDPETIGRFFTRAVYEKLRGNAYFGYSHDEGYAAPAEKTVRLRLAQALPELRRYEDAFLYALAAGGVRAGLKLAPSSPAEVGACLVGVDTASQTGKAGVLIEAYARNSRTGKARFIRFACGRDTLEEALLAAGEIVMRLAAEGGDRR